jgi:ABC-type dipeptide/oligopeptide/nickel transport system ATPase subunit
MFWVPALNCRGNIHPAQTESQIGYLVFNISALLDFQRNLGLSYLFISHDIAVVERVSHRIAVMFLGEIVEIGPR